MRNKNEISEKARMKEKFRKNLLKNTGKIPQKTVKSFLWDTTGDRIDL